MLLALAAASVASCVYAPDTSGVLTPQTAAGAGATSWRPYLNAVRKKIYGFWSYPCLANASTGGCDYQAADVTVEADVQDDGQLGAVRVIKSSGIPLYDDYAVNAVKLAAPFDAVPGDMKSAARPVLKIQMRFNYVPDHIPRPH